MIKAEFSTSLLSLQCHMILQKSFYAKFLVSVVYFSRFFDEKKVQKNSIYLKQESFVTLYMTVTFDQFNTSLLNKSINFIQRNLTTPKYLNDYLFKCIEK